MTDEYGPLRVVEGSHRRPVTIASEDHRTRPHPEEKLLHVKAGDVVFTHCSLLHSGTPNTSGKPRYFFSSYYNRIGLPTKDNHAGPNVQRIVAAARARNDRRLLRLFGVDDLIEARANALFLAPDEELWDRWIAEDRAALRA
jgi:ectoine hydroxylase-related dioxygenase (phytanoyl-CoA dioxygenase family)